MTLLSWDPDDTGEPFSALPRRANDLYGWLLEQYEPVTTAEIADAFGWHRQTVRRHLRRLRPIGLAQRVGATLHGEALWVAGVPYRGGGWVYCNRCGFGVEDGSERHDDHGRVLCPPCYAETR